MKISYLTLLFSLLFVHDAQSATLGFADTVIEFYNSGNGSLDCPEAQGGNFPPAATAANCVPFDAALGDDPGTTSDYVSLPKDSFITLGFVDEYIFDGSGDDIFISEVGEQGENAHIYVSSTYSTDPLDFTFLGTANGNTISAFDLADIGFTDQVVAVKVLSLENGGYPNAPGFDLAHIEAINFSPVPLPVVVDVNNVMVMDQGGGEFLYFWPLSGTGISQLIPGESYVVDVEFLPGQSFELFPNPAGDEVIQLAFGSENGPDIIDPGLVLASGNLEITGLIGDLDVPNPVALDPLLFIGNAGIVDEDFLISVVTGDLTSDGFSFEGLSFTFTLDNQGEIYPVNGGVYLAIFAGADSDGDGIFDSADNCILVPNSTQCDGDGDNYGNHCDGDFNNDLIINGLDVGPLKAGFGTTDPVTDLNCDGITNGLDVGPFKAMFGTAPGPSGLVP